MPIIEVDASVLTAVFAAMDCNRDKWWFSIRDCSDAWGFDRNYFYTHRHLLPNFGIFDDPDHKAFSRETFLKWVVIPLCIHKQHCTDLSADDRRKIEKRRKSG
jgi:hypothetical protein